MPRSQNNVNYSLGVSVWYRNNMTRRKEEGRPVPWKTLPFSTVLPIREAYTKGAASTAFPWGARLSGKRQDPGSVPIPDILPDICPVSVPKAGGNRIPGCSYKANPHLYLLAGKNHSVPWQIFKTNIPQRRTNTIELQGRYLTSGNEFLGRSYLVGVWTDFPSIQLKLCNKCLDDLHMGIWGQCAPFYLLVAVELHIISPPLSSGPCSLQM